MARRFTKLTDSDRRIIQSLLSQKLATPEAVAHRYGITKNYARTIAYGNFKGGRPNYKRDTRPDHPPVLFIPDPERCKSRLPSVIEGSSIKPPSLKQLMGGR